MISLQDCSLLGDDGVVIVLEFIWNIQVVILTGGLDPVLLLMETRGF